MKLEREIDLPASSRRGLRRGHGPAAPWHEWVTIHEDVKEAPPRVLEHGDVMLQRLKVAGKGLDVRWRVTTADRRAAGGLDRRRPGTLDRYLRVPLHARSRRAPSFVYALEFRPPGGILGGFASRAVLSTSVPQRELEGSLERLKALLER
ncbi:MAG: hypothetical protein WKF31_10305 [Thermoleophilaceae bacterium]